MKYVSIKKTGLLVAFFFMTASISFAQNEEVDWSAKGHLVSIDGINVTVESILTKESNAIVWQQMAKGRIRTERFYITQTSGGWDFEKNRGAINYDLEYDGTEAKLRFQENANGITVTLTVHDANSKSSNHVFHIDSLSQL